MNPKIIKIEQEIEKTKQKFEEMQKRLKNLERQKTEMENVEIVAIFRNLNMTPKELADFIQSNQQLINGNITQLEQDEKSEQEEHYN